MLLLEETVRQSLYERLIAVLEEHVRDVARLPVASRLEPEAIRESLARFDFERPVAPEAAFEFVVNGLRRHQVHTPHPAYYGLFNPAPTTMGIVADALVAGFNPQLAAWSHSPFAAEVERHLAQAFGSRLGYPRDSIEGTFASGGAEANHTGLLTALASRFPEYRNAGLRTLARPPVLYVSAEAHHSFAKAARLSGLGTDAVREVEVDEKLAMRVDRLADRIAADRAAGLEPFLVVATFGTTNAGAIDPVDEVAALAREEGLWLHVDAAWGGAVALCPRSRALFRGVEASDSLTLDCHKWLSVPMGAGLFLTRQKGVLEQTFSLATGYMPRDAVGLDVADPYARSIQWSRRAIGMKVLLSLMVAGFEGYAAAVEAMIALGRALRARLRDAGWTLVNDTPLPVVCFTGNDEAGRRPEWLDRVAAHVVGSGRAWISTARLSNGVTALRACITNYRTTETDLDDLVDALGQARERG